MRASSPSAKRARGEKTFDSMASPTRPARAHVREVDCDYRETESARGIHLTLHYMIAFASIS